MRRGGREHSWWHSDHRLMCRFLRWQTGERRAATESWRKRCHRWGYVHPWIVHLGPTLLSHSHYMDTPSSSTWGGLEKKILTEQLVKYQDVLLFWVKSSHMPSGNNIYILRVHSSSSRVHWSSMATICSSLFNYLLHWEKARTKEVCMCHSLNLPQAVILEWGFSLAFMEGFSRNH